MHLFREKKHQKVYEQLVGLLVLFGLIIVATVPDVAQASTDAKTITRVPKVATVVETVIAQGEGLESVSTTTSSISINSTEDGTSNPSLTSVDGKSGELVEEVITNPTPEQVKAEIVLQAKQYGVNEKVALRIAFCESRYDFDAKNRHSTAKGVYQFVDRTWKYIGAEGHQYDYKENIHQFMKWYPKNPNWWECK